IPPKLPPKDMVTAEELENVLEEIKSDERAEPMIYRLLQKERGVYTVGKKKYTIYFQNIMAPDEAELRIEGVTKFLKLGQSTDIGMQHELTLVSILSGASETVGDLVKFYYGTREGLIVDYIEEGETKTYLKEGKKYVITLAMVSDFPDPKAIFEINGERTESLESKDQEIFDDRSFLFVSNIFPNEAKEYTTQKAIEFTILEK
ncbi:hypothetical protein KY335_03435, partial [Candidatus Woesearchaeota archaeon]|nr:hypothetical protein [Candidatus Woesearchaeota archaeon]